MEALLVQVIGNLAGGPTSPVQLEHSVHQRGVVPHLLEAAHGPPDLMAADEAPGPMDDDVDPLSLTLDHDLHSLDDMTYDNPSIRGCRGGRMPQRGDVRGQ
jgi:hypothetical protein